MERFKNFMKKSIGLCALVFFLSSFSYQAEERFVVDVKRSSIEWKASKVGGSHYGEVDLASGNLVFTGNSLKGGSFAAAMRSITVEDLKGRSKDNLTNHLRSNDFFAVADHPTAALQITKVNPISAEQVMITGNLTIKGIINPVSFPAIVKRQGNTVTAEARSIRIDRTKYDIKYRSMRFFSDIADKAIDDEFEISVKLRAEK